MLFEIKLWKSTQTPLHYHTDGDVIKMLYTIPQKHRKDISAGNAMGLKRTVFPAEQNRTLS